jgi:hypothetical protein
VPANEVTNRPWVGEDGLERAMEMLMRMRVQVHAVEMLTGVELSCGVGWWAGSCW